MNIADIEKDLATIAQALEQSLANHNVLIGQKQGLEHVLSKMKEAAKATETVVDAVEQVIDTSPATPQESINEQG